MKTSPLALVLALGLLLGLSTLACGVLPRLLDEPSPTPSPAALEQTLAALQTQISTLQSTSAIQSPTVEPEPVLSPETSPLPTLSGIQVALGPLELVIPETLASQVDVEQVEAVDESTAYGLWEVAPTHWRARLWNYPVIEHIYEPWLYVYPAQDYAAMNEFAADTLTTLHQILRRPILPRYPEDLPHPVFAFDAARVLAASVQRLDFDGGRGLRALTCYAQNATPVENDMLLYEFQGLSQDEQWYILAVLPLNQPILPDAGVGVPDLNDPNADWLGYYQQVTAALEHQPPHSFIPDLRLLDAMLSSMRLTR